MRGGRWRHRAPHGTGCDRPVRGPKSTACPFLSRRGGAGTTSRAPSGEPGHAAWPHPPAAFVPAPEKRPEVSRAQPNISASECFPGCPRPGPGLPRPGCWPFLSLEPRPTSPGHPSGHPGPGVRDGLGALAVSRPCAPSQNRTRMSPWPRSCPALRPGGTKPAPGTYSSPRLTSLCFALHRAPPASPGRLGGLERGLSARITESV